jgi:hypothetical protein
MKKILIFLIFLLNNCSGNSLKNERNNVSSEIICGKNKRFMIRYVYATELKKALYDDIKRKKQHNYKENFTIIRIPKIESFHINGELPENLLKCQIIDDHIKKIYPNYIKRFKNFF